MPRNTTHSVVLPANTAALVLALDADTSQYPFGCNAHVFPDGAFRADDGRPASITGGEVRDWQMSEAIAADLISLFEKSAKPILYDYEHNSLYGDSRAAGWIDRLVYVPGKGVYAHVEWTPKAAEDIAKKVYRYSSPYFYFDPKTGAVKQLISVALTNNPALGDLGAVGLRRTAVLPTPKEADMPDENQVAALTSERDGLKTQLAALTTERDRLNNQVAALATERDAQKTRLDALETEKTNAALAAEQKARDDLLTAACSGDKPLMTPAQAEAVKTLSVAELTKFIDTLKPVPLTQRQGGGSDGGNHGLTQDELAMCSRMGVAPEDYIKSRR